MEMMPLGTQDLNSYHIFLRLVRNHFTKENIVESDGHIFHILHCLQYWVFSGIMDSQAECWEESVLGGSSTRNTLFSWEKLFGGKLDR
jgi:hypothetical protein